ncbi:MAG TPA: hypothetical protein VHJ34_04495 [Actinomycetota bacterium]|nr:hypothetical protein [Actinomycetota bacterium]
MTELGTTGDGPLALRVELHATAPPAGDVVFDNRAANAIRIWRPGSSWGDEALSFELTTGVSQLSVRRRPQRYTRNVATPVEVPPGGSHRRSFDLGDGTWQIAGAEAAPWHAATALVAVYEVRPSRAASDNAVWIGRVRSDPVVVGGGGPGEGA